MPKNPKCVDRILGEFAFGHPFWAASGLPDEDPADFQFWLKQLCADEKPRDLAEETFRIGDVRKCNFYSDTP